MLGSPLQITETSFPATELFWLFFYGLMVAFLIHAIVVCYHWYTFGTGGFWQSIFIATYLAGGALFFIGMLIALLA